MKTRGCYYMILIVYTSLWTCQLITCHLTHSLIVLTDSYVNLYKILDISLGILHLNKQKQLHKLKANKSKVQAKDDDLTISLFDHVCSYQLKRLPVLGSFVNGLFLGALLMSAAIEGIQTCFHSHHSESLGDTSILLEHPVTYPAILVGFALVGVMMQWCSNRVHEMRDEELEAASLLDLRAGPSGPPLPAVRRLDASQLAAEMAAKNAPPGNSHARPATETSSASDACCLRGSGATGGLQQAINSRFLASDRKFVLNRPRPKSFEPVLPSDDCNDGNDNHAKISLKSLKLVPNFEESLAMAVSSISKDLEADDKGAKAGKGPAASGKICDKWLLVRYCISPVALVACASIIYSMHDELVTEVADAFFAVLVVVLLYTASYPPMKKAAKVLLQTAPNGVNVDHLRSKLESLNPAITEVKDLHVWSLTARSNRIGTCHLVLDKDKIESDKQVVSILQEARFKFLEENIRSCTIQPIFRQQPKLNLEN